MSNLPPQQVMISTTRHTLLVMLICYLPHFFTAPWWLFLFVLSAIAYRLLADYFAYPLLSLWIRIILVIGCLFLLKIHYGSLISNGFFIGFLLIFIALKCIEIHTLRDLKAMVFCNFYLIFSALIVIQELWIVIYLIVAVLANLSLMLKLNAPQASLKLIGGKSGQLLLIAIPISVVLFYIFPRISNPLWQVPALNESRTGFSERMSFGSISQLFKDDSTAMRITFANKPVFNGYWQGLILSFYNGVSWSPGPSRGFVPLNLLRDNESGDYEIMLEPHQKKWLFYLGTPVAARPNLLFSSNSGLISQVDEIISQRFSYSLKIQKKTYQELTINEISQYTQLPKWVNPRLSAWAKSQYIKLGQDPQAFIAYLSKYINQHAFWYTLAPPQLGAKNQMDSFWFETRQGFCEHYASALTTILRNVGIPSRVVVGYQGGDWNPFAHYLEIQQKDAHAWVEYWQPGQGWQLLDPTSFIAPERIDDSIKELQAKRFEKEETNLSKMSWSQHLKLFIQSSRFFAERWFLFYNQDTQNDLLEQVGLGNLKLGQLLQMAIISLILFFTLFALTFHWWQKRCQDPLLSEYLLLQKQFKRFNVPILPSSTLQQQCEVLILKAPALAATVSIFLNHYEQLRLQHSGASSKENRKSTLFLFTKLRKKLTQMSPAKLNKTIR